MRQIWFFDRYGAPKILLLDEQRFVSQNGIHFGYIKGNLIYNYLGKHCGWIENGVIRDLSGLCVAFMRGARDNPSPIFPIPQIPPIPSIPQISPIPSIPQIHRIKPLKNFGWSNLSPLTLFQ